MEKSVIGKISSNPVVIEDEVKYCLYSRKSMEQDEAQALSIESQIKEMSQIAERENLNIVEIRKEAHSAKESGQRPVYQQLLEDIRQNKFNGILVWHPDRLSRNAGDLGALVDLMDQKKLVEIRTFGQKFTNTPSEKFLLMILCSQAKLENDNRSINIKRGLRARVEMGLWPCRPPTGYTKFKRTDHKCESVIDPERAPIIKQIFERVAHDGWSGRKVHHWLRHEIDFKTEGGKYLSLGNLYVLLRNTFYYGKFEYPVKSGNWYNGRHVPIISKELFDLAQQKIKSQIIETRSQQKEFAFTKIITCGLCGSGICADEKFKHQKNGNTHRYVYYTCTRAKDKKCSCGYINETDLISKLQNLIDNLEIQKLPMREKIREEIKRYESFQQMLLGTKNTIVIKDINIRTYAKFILQDGSIEEKRKLLSCLNGKLFLKNKIISLS